jgi:hypothetical protein
MNGGAWINLEGTKVGVLLRGLDVTMYWSGRARQGEYEIARCSATSWGAPHTASWQSSR